MRGHEALASPMLVIRAYSGVELEQVRGAAFVAAGYVHPAC